LNLVATPLGAAQAFEDSNGEEGVMGTRTGWRVGAVRCVVVLACWLVAGLGQAQFRGPAQTRQSVTPQTGSSSPNGLVTALQQQQSAVQTACKNANTVQTSSSSTGTGTSTTTGSTTTTDMQTQLQQLQTALTQLQSDLQTALQLTGALLNTLQQSSTSTTSTAQAQAVLQAQQSGLQNALQQTNALLSALQQNNSQDAATQLQALQRQRNVLARQLRALQGRALR
jgi:hypothetical protein